MEDAKSELFYNMLELLDKLMMIAAGAVETAITGGYGRGWLFAVKAFISTGWAVI